LSLINQIHEQIITRMCITQEVGALKCNISFVFSGKDNRGLAQPIRRTGQRTWAKMPK